MDTPQNTDGVQRIHIDQLPPSADEASIRALFEPYGEVFAYEHPVDRQTNVAGAFILVRMDQVDADRAIAALDGSELDGQTIRVERA